jgi:hypothetical protein
MRFISRLSIRGSLSSISLKNQDKFRWTQEAQEALEDLRKYLTTATNPGGPGTPRKLEALHINYNKCGQYNNHH